MSGYSSSSPRVLSGPAAAEPLPGTRRIESADLYNDESSDGDDEHEKPIASHTHTELRKSPRRRERRTVPRIQQRSHLLQLIVALVVVGGGISFAIRHTGAAAPRFSLGRPLRQDTADGGLSVPFDLPPVLVGSRPRFAPEGRSVYQSCGYDALLKSIKGATVRPDGLSAHPNYTNVDYTHLDPFEWSFDLPSVGKADGGGAADYGSDYTIDIEHACEPMHIYTQAEACELLGAFGGLYASGDSYVRHLYTALMMILRDRNDGAVRDRETTDDCRHEHAFDDGRLCRDRINMDTNTEEHVCGNAAQVDYVLIFTYDFFRDWRARLPRTQQSLSPVFIAGLGLHFGFDLSVQPWHDWLETDTAYMNRQSPRPVKIFLGPHRPGVNQQPQFIPAQGPQRLAPYKEEVVKILANVSESTLPQEGSWRYLDTWRMTEGAASYDGSHYSYQVNMEKAQIMLNLLDVLWGEIVAAGGLVRLRPLAGTLV
ncbi:hypothetical protein JCM10908_000655 [Rhodotorula pacifica]|uniref:uncharacterized protein n=1 Tax=Rhodotorula pacifica TaxID=1495444 RepID=UPI003171A6A1